MRTVPRGEGDDGGWGPVFAPALAELKGQVSCLGSEFTTQTDWLSRRVVGMRNLTVGLLIGAVLIAGATGLDQHRMSAEALSLEIANAKASAAKAEADEARAKFELGRIAGAEAKVTEAEAKVTQLRQGSIQAGIIMGQLQSQIDDLQRRRK